MKQMLFEIYTKDSLDACVIDIKKYQKMHSIRSVMFHLYCGVEDKEWIAGIIRQLQEEFPDAGIAGESSYAEIIDGHITDPVVLVSAMLFEITEVRTFCYSDILGKEAEIGAKVKDIIDSIPDIEAAEILMQGSPVDNYAFLLEAQKCRKNVKVFGGLPMGHDIEHGVRYVVHSEGVFENAMVLVTYSGKDFHVDAQHTTGWKPIGHSHTITEAHDNTLVSVDGMPAAKLYEKYLQIFPDENFITNTMEFPLFVGEGNTRMLRHPNEVCEDGSIVLAGHVSKGMQIYMSYGDPNLIIEDVNCRCKEIREFEPEAILLYTCTMRKIFWRSFASNEMMPFQRIATTAGFCTGGELARNLETGNILWHNITLLSIAMREGDKTGRYIPDAKVDVSTLHGQIGLVKRLASLVRVTSDEIQTAMDELRDANAKLKKMATIDELTGLYNRREIEKRIKKALDYAASTDDRVTVIMLDIDFFKDVNDTYGHEVGDQILQEFAKVIDSCMDREKGEITGRWGGEEFFCVLPGTDKEKAGERAEEIRHKVAETKFSGIPKLTCSAGVITTNGEESHDNTFLRVDRALYLAKNSGRNCVVASE